MSAFDQDLEKGNLTHSNATTSSTEYQQGEILANPLPGSDDVGSSKDFNSTVHRITTSQTGDIIYLGNQAFHKHELLNAFGGDFTSGIHPPPSRPMGSPVPLGLAGYGITTFTLSMFFLNARNVTNPQLMAAPATFVGGMVTTICGLWCLLVENTFGAATIGSFGAFYLSYAAILSPSFGIQTAYADSPDEFNSMMGFYLTAWTIYTSSMWLCTFKATWSFFLAIGTIVGFLICLTIGFFLNSNEAKQAAGAFGAISSFCAFYAIYEGVANKQNSYLVPPTLLLPGAPKV